MANNLPNGASTDWQSGPGYPTPVTLEELAQIVETLSADEGDGDSR